MAIRAIPLKTPNINPKAWSGLFKAVLFMTTDKSGVKKETSIKATANTAANDAKIANSQLSDKIGPTKGISWTVSYTHLTLPTIPLV